jgi:hypothetical protein
MPEDQGQLEIQLEVDDDLSPYEFDELTAALQRELLQLDVDSVDRVSAGPAPDGSRGVDLAALGALIVQVGKSAPILGQVVDVIQAWAARAPDRTVEVKIGDDTIKLGGLSEPDQRAVIDSWIARHAAPPAPTQEPGMA